MIIVRAALQAVVPIFAAALTVAIACNDPQPDARSDNADPTAASELSPVRVRISTPIVIPEDIQTRIDGTTWILEEVDGRPLTELKIAA